MFVAAWGRGSQPASPGSRHSSPSALLYINTDFEGGEFIFTEMDAKTVTVSKLPWLAKLMSVGWLGGSILFSFLVHSSRAGAVYS